jgi:predicted 3-demethylubiquinone-9 3-methyltransferase (glyoxalase superfamily)
MNQTALKSDATWRTNAMNKIIPFLWFDGQAEEAARFYVSVFKDGKMGEIARFDEAVAEAAQMPVGAVLTASFEILGNRFVALNGGPAFKFTEAVSFMVHCDTQEELDHYWDKLTEGGEVQMCGWLKDKYGLSWQIVPAPLEAWRHDPEKGARVMAKVMELKKLDFKPLQDAYEGR